MGFHSDRSYPLRTGREGVGVVFYFTEKICYERQKLFVDDPLGISVQCNCDKTGSKSKRSRET